MMAKHRRGRSAESPAADPLPLSLHDVYLLTAESNGQLAVGGLALVVDQVGLTVFAPDGSVAAALAWSDLTILRTTGRTTAPAGEDAVLLEASSSTRTHRFAVPTDDAGTFESTIATITGESRTPPALRPAFRPASVIGRPARIRRSVASPGRRRETRIVLVKPLPWHRRPGGNGRPRGDRVTGVLDRHITATLLCLFRQFWGQ